MTDRPDPTDPPQKPTRLDDTRVAPNEAAAASLPDRQNLADTRADLPPDYREAPPRPDLMTSTPETQTDEGDAVPMDASQEGETTVKRPAKAAPDPRVDAPTEGTAGGNWFVATAVPAEERSTNDPAPAAARNNTMVYGAVGVVVVVVLGLGYLLLS